MFAPPLERLAGRYPRQLLAHDNILVEAAGSFGLIVYDVSDPRRPRRIYHGRGRHSTNTAGVRLWNGILAVEAYGWLRAYRGNCIQVHFFPIPGRSS